VTTSTGGLSFVAREACEQAVEVDEIARHAELLRLDAAGGDQLAGASN